MNFLHAFLRNNFCGLCCGVKQKQILDSYPTKNMDAESIKADFNEHLAVSGEREK